MPCYHPINAWRNKNPNDNGKYTINFKPSGDSDPEGNLQIPCGQCIGCRLEKSRQWAVRCVHEASMYDDNCFITLTYDDEHLPYDGSLIKWHFTDFMKRLRKHHEPGRLRFYMCGEYGEACRVCGENEEICRRIGDHLYTPHLGRPHFHACLFNITFNDLELYMERDGVKIFKSETLQKIWGKGFVTVGAVTFDSAAYVARYVAKKMTGDLAENHYYKVHGITGELYPIEPEYSTMSRGDNEGSGGIGKSWWTKYLDDTRKDFITVRGVKQRPPKYYDLLMEAKELDCLYAVKEDRLYDAFENIDESLPHRLKVKEHIKLKKFNQLPRNLK